MLLGLATAAIVLTALVCELAGPTLRTALARARERRLLFVRDRHGTRELSYDPGRERRAELRAGALLRSCVNEDEWAMYRDLGFLRVWGHSGARASTEPGPGAEPGAKAGRWAVRDSGAEPRPGAQTAEPKPGAEIEPSVGRDTETPRYAYLIYPHKPIVAYRPQTGTMLSEYCVAFPDHSRPYGSARLPDSDDVLAKWMALTADEHRLIADANMHLPGRQVDPERVRRDLARLARWERERIRDSRDGWNVSRGRAADAQDASCVGHGELGADS